MKHNRFKFPYAFNGDYVLWGEAIQALTSGEYDGKAISEMLSQFFHNMKAHELKPTASRDSYGRVRIPEFEARHIIQAAFVQNHVHSLLHNRPDICENVHGIQALGNIVVGNYFCIDLQNYFAEKLGKEIANIPNLGLVFQYAANAKVSKHYKVLHDVCCERIAQEIEKCGPNQSPMINYNDRSVELRHIAQMDVLNLRVRKAASTKIWKDSESGQAQ